MDKTMPPKTKCTRLDEQLHNSISLKVFQKAFNVPSGILETGSNDAECCTKACTRMYEEGLFGSCTSLALQIVLELATSNLDDVLLLS